MRERRSLLASVRRSDIGRNIPHFRIDSLNESERSIYLIQQQFGILARHRYICFGDRKLSAGTIEGRTAALRFLYVRTLKRPYLHDQIPFPKRQRPLPTVLSQEEVARLIDSARNLMHRAMLMTIYGTGVRRTELCQLRVDDIDSERMVIRVRHGKGGRDRDVLLSNSLLETLREYWRWMKPKTYLFPGTVNNWRADVPITTKIVWNAVNEARIKAGIQKRVLHIR